jgi:hypothetical protein
MWSECNGMCVDAATKTEDVKFTYVYHTRDGVASPAVVFHDAEKCVLWKEEGDNG